MCYSQFISKGAVLSVVKRTGLLNNLSYAVVQKKEDGLQVRIFIICGVLFPALVTLAASADEQVVELATRTPRCFKLSLAKGGAIKKEDMIGVDDRELMTRLVYAESLAANCPQSKDDVSRAIARVVWTRVRLFDEKKMSEPYKRTVFGKKQFASALHAYRHSQWKEFICPTHTEFFRNIQSYVESLHSSAQALSSKAGTHYYLHRHYGAFRTHPWGKKARLEEMVGDKCLGVYEVDKAFLNAGY